MWKVTVCWQCLLYFMLSRTKVLCKCLNPVWQHHFHLTGRWLQALSASHLQLMKLPFHVNLGYAEGLPVFLNNHFVTGLLCMKNRSRLSRKVKQQLESSKPRNESLSQQWDLFLLPFIRVLDEYKSETRCIYTVGKQRGIKWDGALRNF